ncbi:MAG: MFS transporter [Cyclobacteriaceae bacterium]
MLQENKEQSQATVYPILFAISFAHLINDVLQSVILAVYPLLKLEYSLTFTQIGLITLVYQLTASILQPLVGISTDKKPEPFSLTVGMGFSLAGIIALSMASSYTWILLSVSLIGVGSSIFHPESSRVANLASGGKRGKAQSIFQIGGNVGTAIGPMIVAFLVIPYGQENVLWFAVAALAGMIVLFKVAKWYKSHLKAKRNTGKVTTWNTQISKRNALISIGILVILIFSKYFYLVSMTNYLTFYLIEKFQVSVQESQFYLFAFLGAIATGTYLGGPLGDRFGRKFIIWISILGVAPFTLLLPYAGLFWVMVLSIFIGIIISSAFSAILVYAQELVPGRIGMISGLFYGLAFGLGGIGSAILGNLADKTSIEYVFQLCSFLPLIGLITWALPNIREERG